MNAASSVERVPPQSLEAEQSALGAMMLDREAAAVGVEILRRTDFYREVHARIFDAITALFDRNEPVDLITLSDELQHKNHLEDIGGPAYLTTLVSSVPTAANMHHYATIVAEKAMLRELISAATDIADWSYADEEDASLIVDRAEARLFRVTERRIGRGFHHLGALVKQAFTQLDDNVHSRRELTGLATGFADLDRIIGGLVPSTLFIVAGRPSMGKTSLAMNIATHVGTSRGSNGVVAIFSLEMSKEQLVEAILSAEARINLHNLRLGNMSDTAWDRLAGTLDTLYESRMFIDDTPGISTLEMRAKARRLKAERGLDLIVADHIQLLTYPFRFDSRHEEISAITRQLKSMARELEVPVLATSQLSRSVERRDDKRPILSDLMESGYIEAEADVVSFIYRPEYYKYRRAAEFGQPQQLVGGPLARHDDNGDGGLSDTRDDTAEIIVAKNRSGPTGVCELVFSGQYRRFDSKAHHRVSPAEVDAF